MPLPKTGATVDYASAQDVAYSAIRKWIFEGPLQPGDVILDTDIAQLLGIGRTPVREAIIRLVQDGLIEQGKGRKTRVSMPDVTRAPELYQIGGMIDGLAAEIATPKMRAEDIQQLRDVSANMAQEEEPSRLVELDLAFHEVFRRLAGQVVQEKIAEIESELSRLERLAFGDEDIRTFTIVDHRRILNAMASGQASEAAEAVRKNWAGAWKRLAERISGDKAIQYPLGNSEPSKGE